MKKEQRYTALYERLSHDDELQGESNNISNQKKLLMEYAVSHELPSPRHFADDGISGTRFDRPAFLEMMGEIEDGNIGAVLVKDACVIITLISEKPYEYWAWLMRVLFFDQKDGSRCLAGDIG